MLILSLPSCRAENPPPCQHHYRDRGHLLIRHRVHTHMTSLRMLNAPSVNTTGEVCVYIYGLNAKRKKILLAMELGSKEGE